MAKVILVPAGFDMSPISVERGFVLAPELVGQTIKSSQIIDKKSTFYNKLTTNQNESFVVSAGVIKAAGFSMTEFEENTVKISGVKPFTLALVEMEKPQA